MNHTTLTAQNLPRYVKAKDVDYSLIKPLTE